jgi:ubiquinone/menaquinone biosynthesis C-methylase UbiE
MVLKGRDFWNKIASDYHSGRTKSRKYLLDPALFEVIGNVRGKKVLDIACGAGDISIKLTQRGAKCIGLDFSKELIELAKKEAGKLRLDVDYRVMDAKNIGVLKRKFDLAIVALFFPHLKKFKDIVKAIRNIQKLLKENGRLVVAEPHPAFDFYMRNRLKSGNFKYFSSGLPYKFQMVICKHPLSSEAYHWTLQDYSRAFFEGGFIIRRIIEPQPSPKSKSIDPKWFKERSKYPSYIIFDCARR